MAIEAMFDEDRKVLFITVSGTWPTLPEIIAERSRLILAGYVRESVVELVDARTVRRGIPNLSQMKAILNAIGKMPHKRRVAARRAHGRPAAARARLSPSRGNILTGKSITMRITTKGQVTIPLEIREKHGFHPHTEVEFVVERGRVFLKRKKGSISRVDRMMDHFRNAPKMRVSSKALLAVLRDEPDELNSD